MATNSMTWNVYYHNFNQNKIEIYNIFDHGGFNKGVKEILNKCKTKEELAEELRMELNYYFWSRAEWEAAIKPWCGGGDYRGIRIDVCDQVMLNFDVFVDYVIERACWFDENGK